MTQGPFHVSYRPNSANADTKNVILNLKIRESVPLTVIEEN